MTSSGNVWNAYAHPNSTRKPVVYMVRIAQRGRAHDRVQVLNRCPRAIQPVERVGKRLGDVVPARRAGIGGDDVDRVARSVDEKVDCRSHVLGTYRVEARQARKVEQRIGGVFGVHSGFRSAACSTQ